MEVTISMTAWQKKHPNQHKKEKKDGQNKPKLF
jgi:hypothetical protein